MGKRRGDSDHVEWNGSTQTLPHEMNLPLHLLHPPQAALEPFPLLFVAASPTPFKIASALSRLVPTLPQSFSHVLQVAGDHRRKPLTLRFLLPGWAMTSFHLYRELKTRTFLFISITSCSFKLLGKSCRQWPPRMWLERKPWRVRHR
jgi:hypothetical protein